MKKYFITGLVILLPLALTIAIIVFLINFLTEPFVGMVSSLVIKLGIANKSFLFLSPEQILQYSSKLLILITLFIATVILGMLARWFFINALLKLGDKILLRIPLVNTVYKTTQEIIKTLFASDKNSFKQVVMVPFPRSDIYVLGLIARESPPVCREKVGEELISVLVPTTPNPTTGFLLMYRKEDLIFVDMKPEEAIKYIISCGMIVPPSSTPTPMPIP